MKDTKSLFEERFCQDSFLDEGEPVRLPNGDYKYTARFDGEQGYFQVLKEEEDFVICISTEKEIQFEGCELSTDKILWRQRETPLQGRVYARPKEGIVETWITSESYASIDLEKSSKELDSILLNGQKSPSLFLFKKKSSMALLKEELDRHNIDYTVEYTGSNNYNYLIKDAVTVLENGFFSSKIPLYPEDFLVKDSYSYRVGEHSEDQLGLSLSEGLHSVKRTNINFSPQTGEPITSVLLDIAKSTRQVSSEREKVRVLLEREAPFRLKWSIVQVNKRLTATPKVVANLLLDRTEGIKSATEEGVITSQFYIGWPEGSLLKFYILTKNIPEWKLASIETIRGEPSLRLKVTPELSTSFKTLVTVENLETNREFERKRYILKFKSTSSQVYIRVGVDVLEWNPKTEEVSVKERLQVADKQTSQGNSLKELISIQEELSRENKAIKENTSIVDSVGGQATNTRDLINLEETNNFSEE